MSAFGLRLRRWRAVARVEILQLLHDRPTLRIVVVVPIFQLLLFGYAVRFEPRRVPIAIARETAIPDGLLRLAIDNTETFKVVGDGLPAGDANRLVRQRRALIGIDFARSSPGSDDESADTIAVTVDDSDLETSTPALRGLEAALLREERDRPGAVSVPILLQELYNPKHRVTWSIIPALSGVIAMITMLLLGALAHVRERELGTWEGLLLTPVTGLDALIGKLGPYVLLGTFQAVAVVLLGERLFDLPMRGNLLLLLGSTVLLVIAYLALGFAISTLVESQVQAIQSAVIFYLPSILLSGFVFPFSAMPRWAQLCGEALPLTHFVRAARGLVLRGDSAVMVLHEMWPVAVFASLAATVATSQYRRHLA